MPVGLRRVAIGVVSAAWLTGIGLGLTWWEAYERRAGEWPAAEGGRIAPSGYWELQLFLHPHCPCSRGSVEQFQHLVQRLEGQKVSATVWLVRPPEAAAGWEAGEMLEQLRRWGGAAVRLDAGGEVARRWKAAVSGHVVVTDPQGRIRFRGGLTRGRQRRGAGPACDAIVRMVEFGADNTSPANSDSEEESPTEPLTAPVFGCPLWTPPASQE